MKLTIKINTENENFKSPKGSFLKFDQSQLEEMIDKVKKSVMEYNLDFDYNNALHDFNGNLVGSIKIKR
jgi:hypothetical protein